MLENSSRMDRFYDELEDFLTTSKTEKTWNDVFKSDSKRMLKYIKEAHSSYLDAEIEEISKSKVRVTVKKTK